MAAEAAAATTGTVPSDLPASAERRAEHPAARAVRVARAAVATRLVAVVREGLPVVVLPVVARPVVARPVVVLPVVVLPVVVLPVVVLPVVV
ncbi:hypothetical protein, partial [Burkholderia cepacia]|uniref:hypothetical protein n=1 Tax=Burkholderia cepacia TaxID=292 RepID=UPI001CE3E807